MKTNAKWVKLFLKTVGAATMLLIAVGLLRGRELDTVLSQAFIWGLIGGSIFTAAQWDKARRNAQCALCRD
jgi:hypothetical protein